MTRPASKAWTLIHHRNLEIIEVRYAGAITAQDMLEGSVARLELAAKESVSDFLLDGSECTADKATAEVVYDIVTREYPIRRVDPNSRFAFLPPESPHALWLVDFFEAMCEQHGLASRRFPDRDSAIAWLTSADAPSADIPE
ncbi:MAG: hypothetical protein QNI99_02430 [Woeseiaceae bacterium]|nr:hypothetical protein [Woeseiaceae bacterium]